MADQEKDEGVLSRWSRRKRGMSEEEEIEEVSPEELEQLQEERDLELAANREAAEAIDLDTIDEDSDLSLFMKDGVPQALKKAALAKLWKSSPVFANVDGLVDYDDNFADPNLILKTFTSAYQVGRGYLKEVLEEEHAEEAVSDDLEIAPDAESELAADESEVVQEHSPSEPEADASIDDAVPVQEEEGEDDTQSPPVKISLRKRWDLA